MTQLFPRDFIINLPRHLTTSAPFGFEFDGDNETGTSTSLIIHRIDDFSSSRPNLAQDERPAPPHEAPGISVASDQRCFIP